MRYLALLIFLIIWGLASFNLSLNTMFLPDLKGVVSLLTDMDFVIIAFSNLWITFLRVLIGTFLAAVIGIPLGLFLANNRLARGFIEPMLDFIRGVPISMLFPLFIVFAGFGEFSRALIVVTLALPIISTSVLMAAIPNPNNQERVDYFSLRANLLSFDTKIRNLLWEALPGILTGLKLSLSLGLVIVIVTEMFFVATSGIGWLAFSAYEQFAIDKMYIYIFIAGFCSLGLNWVLERISKNYSK